MMAEDKKTDKPEEKKPEQTLENTKDQEESVASASKTSKEPSDKSDKSQKNNDGSSEDKTKQLEDFRTLGEPSKAKKKTKKSEPAATKKSTPKKKDKGEVNIPELERVYVVPLRRGFLKVPRHKRSKKAIKTLKEFLAKHMKVKDRDTNNVKIDLYLNNEIWHRGIKKPLNKVRVNAKKYDGIVYASLQTIPSEVGFKMQKDAKRSKKVDKDKMDKVVAQEAEEEKKRKARSDKEDPTAEKEKEAAVAEAGAELNKELAKEQKHTTDPKHPKTDEHEMSSTTKRKALKK